MTDVAETKSGTQPASQGRETVRPSSDTRERARLGTRDRLPAIGLREYWYPATLARRVSRRRPTRVRLLGEDLTLFRHEKGGVGAISSVCPHRGASLARGRCHFAGTITCPYHGWTFDGEGNCVAVLGEGPDSKIPGQPSARARHYPTETHKGVVFVWMGSGEPAPITEDVPPEFFDPRSLVLARDRVWKANWRPAIENFADSHVFYVHRNSLEVATQGPTALYGLLHAGATRPPTRVDNGRALVFDRGNAPTLTRYMELDREQRLLGSGEGETARPDLSRFQDVYPQLGGAKWPKTRIRLYISRACGAIRRLAPDPGPLMGDDIEWGTGVHLPGIVRVDFHKNVFSRASVPMDENSTNNFYYHTTYPRTKLRRLMLWVYFVAWYNWKMNRNFSGQDQRMVENQDYETREKLTPSDRFPRDFRRLVIDHARPSPHGNTEGERA
jgi:phenylpropionate dioxygenase-like ring-hydroxylating dioxygenase large terminal subunit